MSWFLTEKQKLQKTCQTQILKSQQSLIDGGQALIQLNPLVNMLVLEKNHWQNAAAIDPTPPGKAAALAQLARVTLQINLLRQKQNLLIQLSEFKAFKDLLSLQYKLRKQVRTISKLWGTKLPRPRVQTKQPNIMLQKTYS